MLHMETERLPKGAKWPGYRKGAQFATAMGYYCLPCSPDRKILAPTFEYQRLTYRSSPTSTQIRSKMQCMQDTATSASSG